MVDHSPQPEVRPSLVDVAGQLGEGSLTPHPESESGNLHRRVEDRLGSPYRIHERSPLSTMERAGHEFTFQYIGNESGNLGGDILGDQMSRQDSPGGQRHQNCSRLPKL